MRLKKIKINDLFFLLLCLCLMVFSINYKIIASFRLLDIVFIILFIFFIASNPKVDRKLLAVLSVITVLLCTSSLGELFESTSVKLAKFGFIYKYVFIFAVPWLVVSIVKTKEQVKIINWLLLVNFIFLSSWAYIYLFFLKIGIIQGGIRPSFPLSNNYYIPDSHLFSAYIGFFIVAYVFYLRRFFRHTFEVSFLITINGIVGLIFTGSRTGLVLVGMAFLMYLIYVVSNSSFFKQKILIRKKTLIFCILLLLVIPIIIYIYGSNIDALLANYTGLIKRAFNFDLTRDQSSLARLHKLIIGINDAKYSGWLLGMGLYSSLIWYDSLFGILIAHGGLLFLFVIFYYYYIIIKKAATNSMNKKSFTTFFLLVILYLLANIISEYIFVSRNAFPVLSMLSVIYINIFSEKVEKENNRV